MAQTYDISVDAGSKFQVVFEWKDSSGVAIDMTGYSARMHIRSDIDQQSPDIALSTESGITITEQSGEILVELTPSQTKTVKNGYYDLEIVSPSGAVTRLVQGALTVQLEVTRE